MTQFRSLYLREAQETERLTGDARPWPATYRLPLPDLLSPETPLNVRCENQLAKSMTPKQLAILPSFTESRRISSRAGWTYYGQWKGLTFQTLFSMFATPNMYPWVKLESHNGTHCIISRTDLLNWRVVLECDGQALNSLYGGPVWVHNFDYHVEYALPSIRSIVLMQGEHVPHHPAEAMGYKLDDARVLHGEYFAIHHGKIASL